MLRLRSTMSIGSILLLNFVAGCSQPPAVVNQPPPDTRAAAEKTIRDASIEWNNVTQAKDLDKFMAYYADSVVRMKNNSPNITGRDNIRADWQKLFAMPDTNLAFKTTSVVVSKSGDLAVEEGIYDIVSKVKKKTNDEKGKYIVVWGKQADGMWKAIADMENYGH
jgi:uncharacterized protein (TIGR02246 family)